MTTASAWTAALGLPGPGLVLPWPALAQVQLPLDERLVGAALFLLIVFLVLYAAFAGFSMVGITPGEVVVILFLAPFLAPLNIPVWELPGLVIGVNAAGAIIPIILSVRFVAKGRLPAHKALVGVGVVTVVGFLVATVDPERGVLVPAIPVVAASLAVGLAVSAGRWEQVGPATYASGALGTLIGADLLNLMQLVDADRSEPLFAVIGGAGTLDAIYLIALVAVLFAIVAVATARVLEAMR